MNRPTRATLITLAVQTTTDTRHQGAGW